MPGGGALTTSSHAGGKRLRQRDGPDVVAQRAEAQQDRALVVAPVRDHRAGVGEQRVVGMHDAFRRPGRARGESEINDLVRVHRRRGGSGSSGRIGERRGAVAPVSPSE